MWLGLAWRRQAPPLLYDADARRAGIVVAALASAMFAHTAPLGACNNLWVMGRLWTSFTSPAGTLPVNTRSLPPLRLQQPYFLWQAQRQQATIGTARRHVASERRRRDLKGRYFQRLDDSSPCLIS